MDLWRRNLQQMNERKRREASFARIRMGARFLIPVVLGLGILWWLFPGYAPPMFNDPAEPEISTVMNQGSDESTSPLASWQEAAETEDPAAQCRLGTALIEGSHGATIDKIEGVKWLDLCMRTEDHPTEDEAARLLTDRLIQELGWELVGEGRYRSFQWQQAKLNAAAGQPNGASDLLLSDLATMSGNDAFKLGADLYAGRNMPVDYEKGLAAFRRAAEFDLPEAAFNVGLSLYAGKGAKADPVEALHWLDIAAEGGFAQAATMAGVMTARGHGTAPDADRAIAYLELAAGLGDAAAPLIAAAIAEGNIPK